VLIVALRNISDLADVSDYDFEVYINRTRIASGTVRGHERARGWAALLKLLAEQAEGLLKDKGR
jgi:hypothetical protein